MKNILRKKLYGILFVIISLLTSWLSLDITKCNSDLMLEDINANAQTCYVSDPYEVAPPLLPIQTEFYFMGCTPYDKGDKFCVTETVFIEGSVQTTCEATAKGLFPGGSIGGSVRVTVSGKVGYNVKVSYETSSASHEWKAVNCRKEQTNCPEFQKGKDIDRHVYRTSGCSNSNYESEIGSFWESI